MKPTTVLSNEHRVIEVMLNCLEKMANEAVEKGKLEREPAEQAVDFIRNFADKCHHGKEEDHLFTTLERKGMPADGGPVGVMLNEHEQGRALVKAMADNIPAASEGDTQALGTFTSAAREYILLLRNHIQKEDKILFPMADRFLSDDDQTKLEETFKRVESEHMGVGTHERYIDIAKSLAKRYSVALDTIPTDTACCGH